MIEYDYMYTTQSKRHIEVVERESTVTDDFSRKVLYSKEINNAIIRTAWLLFSD